MRFRFTYPHNSMDTHREGRVGSTICCEAIIAIDTDSNDWHDSVVAECHCVGDGSH
jgi:hypothetical protein